jgi:hypothetical protein
MNSSTKRTHHRAVPCVALWLLRSRQSAVPDLILQCRWPGGSGNGNNCRCSLYGAVTTMPSDRPGMQGCDVRRKAVRTTHVYAHLLVHAVLSRWHSVRLPGGSALTCPKASQTSRCVLLNAWLPALMQWRFWQHSALQSKVLRMLRCWHLQQSCGAACVEAPCCQSWQACCIC